MSKESNNNLEDFFKNSLKNYSENPSDDLWDRIEGSIPPKPSKRFKPAYALLALLLLLIMGFGYEYFHFKNHMLTVNETISLQKQELTDLKNQLEVVKDQLQSASSSLNVETTPAGNISEVSVSQKESKALKSNEPSTAIINAAVNIPTVLDVEHKTAVTQNGKTETKDLEILIPERSELENATFAAESVASLDYLALKPIAINRLTYDKMPIIAIPKKSNKAFSVELYTSVLKSFTNNSQSTGSQAKTKNWKLSNDFGALFNLGLNKNWDVQLGLGYNRMVINDAVSTGLVYSRDELDEARGTYTSFYSFTVETPSGEIMLNASLSNERINDGRDLVVGDPFKLDLQFQDEIHYFQLPVFIRYKIGSGKYRFTLKSGFIQKFLLDEKIKLSAVNTDFDRLQNEATYISGEQTSAKTTSIDALFGAGAEYRFSQRNSIHLQSIFSYSLQEIYPGVQPFSFGLQLGVQHQIGR